MKVSAFTLLFLLFTKLHIGKPGSLKYLLDSYQILQRHGCSSNLLEIVLEGRLLADPNQMQV